MDMFKLGVSSVLMSSFLVTAAIAEEEATVLDLDYGQTAEQGACLSGLEMVRTPPTAVSEYDGLPLTADDIAEIHDTGAFLVAKFCGPTA